MRKPLWLIASLSVAFSFVASHESQQCSAAESTNPTGNIKYTYQGHNITKAQYEALMVFNESYQSMKKGNYAESCEKLEKALALDPNLYQARTNYGFVLSRLGRAEEGITELKKALEIDPTAPEAIATLAAMYQAQGKLTDAIDLYSQVLKRYPKHPMALSIASVITQLREQNKRELEIAKSAPATPDNSDYFSHATYESTVKWLPSKLPLKVYVPSDAGTKNIPNYRPEFGVALTEAFQEWSDASAGAVKYNFVNNIKDSDIDVLWTSDSSKVTRPSEGGEARVGFDTEHGITHAQIILLTKTPDGTETFVPVNIIKAACLHEIGHGLGILGHSPDPNDVMFCSVPAADQPRTVTSRDGKTLAHLYRDDVKLAHHYHESVGGTDKIAMNNEGVNFASNQQFSKAAEKFEASLKLDPTYEPARQNLGACLNNIAIEFAKAGKYSEAAARFKRSIDLQQNSKDKEKVATIMRNYAFVLSRLNRSAEAQAVKAAVTKLTSDTAVTSLKK